MQTKKTGGMTNHPLNSHNLKLNSSTDRLPNQLRMQALKRSRERFRAYSNAYLFCINRRNKHISNSAAYSALINTYKKKQSECLKASKQADQEAREYLELMHLAWGEILKLEAQGEKYDN